MLTPRFSEKKGRNLMKRILCVLSEYGYWGEELVEPLELFDEKGYKTDFITPRGGRPQVISVSMDPEFIDPAQGKRVVSEVVAKKVRAIENSNRLDKVLNLSTLMPERPYFCETNHLRKLEDFYMDLEEAKGRFKDFDALLMVGGSGPIIDMANSGRLHDLILFFINQNKPVAAECYATTALAFARDPRLKHCILRGKRVTGHPIEFDYKDNYGFVGLPAIHEVPYPLEYILRDAVGPEGEFIGNVGSEASVVVDFPIITSRSTASSRLCGEKLIECLEKGLKRFGW